MANLNDLELNDDVVPEINPEDMKEQRGGRTEPLYPGDYLFTLPSEFDFKPVETDKGQRVAVVFREDKALQTPAGPVNTQISNVERVIVDFDTKEESLVNDFGFLLKALGFKGPLKTNRDYAQALSEFPGAKFLGTIEWSAYCNPKREKYVDGEKQEDTGCGARYGQKSYKKRNGEVVTAIPKADGKFASTFTCSCGAELNVFQNIQRIRAKK